MTGLIRTRDVLRHAPTVVRCYGWKCFIAALWAGVTRTRRTWLSIVWEQR